jgi:MFS family permease
MLSSIASTASETAPAVMSGGRRSVTALLPIMEAVLIAFLVIGLALPVLPLHVHQGLGLSTFVVGLVTGSQFAASLISRVWAGRFSDLRGAKRAVVTGLLTAVVSGLLYLASLAFVGAPCCPSAFCLLAAPCSAGRKASSSRVR